MDGYLEKYNLNNLSFYKSIKPFYCILKIFGFAPYSLDFNTGIIKLTLFNYLILFVNIILHLTFITLVIQILYGVEKPIWNYLQLLQTLIAFFVVVHNYIMRQHVFNYIKLIDNVDKMVNKLQWTFKVNHLRNCSKAAFWLTAHGVLIIMFYFIILFVNIDETMNEESFLILILNNLFLMFPIHIYMMVVYEFIFSVCSINSQFDCLNKNAEFYLNSFKINLFWSQSQIDNKVKCIKKMAWIHYSLNDAIDHINNVYSIEVNYFSLHILIYCLIIYYFQMIPIFFLTFFTQVITSFVLLSTFMSDVKDTHKLYVAIFWGYFQSIPVVTAFHVASKATEKGKQMSLIIGKVLINSEDQDVINQVMNQQVP